MPKTSINVLLIEDNPADALLLEEALGNDPLANFHVTVAERLSFGLKKLDTENFDILLLDLGLPDSQGFETFEIAHAQFPEIPVVVLSGLADELLALQAVQAGAQDYLVKGESGWGLGSRAIRYAIERFQTQTAMRVSEARFSKVFHSSPTSIAITRLSDNQIIEVNEAWTVITGYSSAEVVGRAIGELNLWVHPEERQKFINILRQKGLVRGFEFQSRRKSGEIADLLFSGELIDIAGEPCMLSMALDVTERKRVEDQLRKLSSTVEQSPISIVITDVMGNMEYVNPQFSEVTGYSLEEAIRQNPRILKSGHSTEEEYKKLWDTITSGKIWRGEFLNKRKDGKTYWEFATIAPVFGDDGKITNFLAMKENITKRKQAEDRLKLRESYLTAIIENQPGLVWLKDKDSRFLAVNTAFALSCGKNTPDEVTGKTDLEVWPDQLAQKYMADDARVVGGKISASFEEQIFDRGKLKWFETFKTPVFDEAGNVIGSAGYARDITERKQAEELLRESEARYRTLIENVGEGIGFVDSEERLLFANPAGLEIFGLSPDSQVVHNLSEFTTPDQFNLILDQTKQRTVGEKTTYELAIKRLNGEERYLLVTAVPQIDNLGQFMGTFGVFHDITERRQAEEMVARTEKRSQALIENAPDGIVLIGLDGKYKYASPAALRIFNYKLEDIIGANPHEQTHPDDLPMVLDVLHDLIVNPSRAPIIKYRFLHQNGTWRWIESAFTNLLDEPSVDAIVINFRDITESKLAGEAVKDSEEKFRTFIEQSTDGLAIFDEYGRAIEWNRAQEQITGMPRSQALGMTMWEIQSSLALLEWNSPQKVAAFKEIVLESLQTGRSLFLGRVFDVELKMGLDEKKYIQQISFPMKSENGYRIGAIVRDITERKMADEKLRESEERLRLAYDAAELGSWREDIDARASHLDPRACKHYDLDEADVCSQVISSRTHPEDLPRLIVEIRAAVESSTNGRLVTEYRVVYRDGSVHWLAVHARLHFEEQNGKRIPIFATGTTQDITSRKESEQKLIQRTQQLRLINESTRSLNASLKPQAVCDVIYSSISQLMPCDTLFISSFESTTKMIALTSGWHDGKPLDVSRYEPIPLEPEGSGTQSEVIRSKQALLVPDFQARLKKTQVAHHFDTEGNLEETLPEDEDIPRSALVVPLIIEDMVFGVIQVFSYRINAYSEDDLQTLNGFSAQAAIALGNAHLYEHIQQENLERIRAEKALLASESKYRLLVESIQVGVVVHAPDSRILFANLQASQLLGLTQDQMLGKTVIDPDWHFIREDGTRMPLDEYPASHALATDEPLSSQTLGILRHDQKDPVWVQCATHSIRNADHQLQQVVVTFIDITERKNAEDRLDVSREFLNSVQDALSAHLSILDHEGNIVQVNSAWRNFGALNGLAHPDHCIGMNYLKICDSAKGADAEEAGAAAKAIRAVLSGERDVAWFEYACHAPGEKHWFVARITSFENNRQKWIVVAHENITARKQAEENIHQRAMELELLYENGLAISQLLKPKEIAQKIIELLEEKMDWHHTAIRLIRPQDNSLELVAFDQRGAGGKGDDRLVEAHLSALIPNLGRGLSGWALEQSKTVRSGDVGSDPHYIATYPGIHSGLYVPLKSGEHLLGVISIESEKPNAFSEADEQLIITLANQAANAFENARLYQEISRYAEDLEQRVQERTLEIESTRQRLELAVKTAGIGIWELDIKKNQDYWDEGLFTLYGLTRENALPTPQTWRNVIHPDDLLEQLKIMEEALHHNQPYNAEFRVIWPDTSIHYIKSTGVVIHDAENFPDRMIGANQDITIHKQAEETLRLANAEMERGLRMKNEFLANMSHELRTPLNAILGISESLEEQISGKLNEKQLKYIRTISESGRHLLDLINDILDLSKIEAGKLELDIQPVSVEKLCTSSLRLVKELAQKKSLNLSFYLDQNVKTILGDERRLKQSLVNLLGNAVKFTPQGKKIGLEVKGNAAANEVTFTVWDEGIGINEDDMQRLFKPFIQLNASLTREFSGTGLGLALVAQMTRLHGGRISLTSELKNGSRFTITLPWLAPEQNSQPSLTSSVLADSPKRDTKQRMGKILIVDDTEVVAQLLSEYLRHKGYETLVAQNGEEAVTLARQELPQIILMDVMMPVLNGLDATRQIRADAAMRDIPIIGLTALAMSSDREQCLSAGMNDYLSKPIQMQEVAQMIDRYLPKPK